MCLFLRCGLLHRDTPQRTELGISVVSPISLQPVNCLNHATIQQGQQPALCSLDELARNWFQQRGGPNSRPETQSDFIHFTTIRSLPTAVLPLIPPWQESLPLACIRTTVRLT